MSRKVKKRISALSYSINKFYRKLSTTKPSTLILSVFAIAIATFLFGGGIYDITVRPYVSIYQDLPGGGRFIFLYPRLSEQFITDSVIAMILYSLGIVGLVIIYQSTKYAYKSRQAYMMLLAGVAFLSIAYIFLEAAIRMKIS